jgi:hypothetical protein
MVLSVEFILREAGSWREELGISPLSFPQRVKWLTNPRIFVFRGLTALILAVSAPAAIVPRLSFCERLTETDERHIYSFITLRLLLPL